MNALEYLGRLAACILLLNFLKGLAIIVWESERCMERISCEISRPVLASFLPIAKFSPFPTFGRRKKMMGSGEERRRVQRKPATMYDFYNTSSIKQMAKRRTDLWLTSTSLILSRHYRYLPRIRRGLKTMTNNKENCSQYQCNPFRALKTVFSSRYFSIKFNKFKK